MFICKKCVDLKPGQAVMLRKSLGECEICHETDVCFDLPPSMIKLNEEAQRERTKGANGNEP